MADTRKDQQLTDEEIARRRDAGLRALLKTPPKPHDQIAGKGKATQGTVDTASAQNKDKVRESKGDDRRRSRRKS